MSPIARRSAAATALALLACLSALAPRAARADELDTALALALAKVEPKVIAWRRDFHQNPELSNREFRTSKKVAEHLRSLGLEVETRVARTGVVAVIRGALPGPTIALRADMDALPITEEVDLPFRSTVKSTYRGEPVGVMHACGHDAHTAILMGLAEALVAVRTRLPGSVVLLFQPAEEGAPEGEEGGAALMLKEGVFEKYKPEAAFGLHVTPIMRTGQVGYRAGPMRRVGFVPDRRPRPRHARRAPLGRRRPDRDLRAGDRRAADHRQPPGRHHREPRGGDHRRDQGRHPQQRGAGRSRDARHDPHLRRATARRHLRARPAHRRRHRRREWRDRELRT